MYKINYGSSLIYDPTDPSLYIRDPDVHLGVSEAGYVNFTTDSDTDFRLRTGKIKLLDDNVCIYRGRVIRKEKDFYGSRRI